MLCFVKGVPEGYPHAQEQLRFVKQAHEAKEVSDTLNLLAKFIGKVVIFSNVPMYHNKSSDSALTPLAELRAASPGDRRGCEG